jgi:hypothetical protein
MTGAENWNLLWVWDVLVLAPLPLAVWFALRMLDWEVSE